MAKDDILEPIGVRAFFVWAPPGRRAGGDLEFWDQARKEIEAEQEQQALLNSEG